MGLPERPTGLRLTAGTGRSVTAAWTAVDGAASYQVRWRQGGDFQPADQHTVTAATATFTASAGGRWIVRVEACNAAGCGWGASTAIVVGLPERPTGLWLKAGEERSVTAAWTAVDGATSYRVRWRQGGDFQPDDQHTVTATTTTTFTASTAGNWTVRVEACNAAGCGPRGQCHRRGGRPPPPLVGLSAMPSGGLIAAYWSASAGATSYQVSWRQPNAGFQSDTTTSVTATSVVITVDKIGKWVVRVQPCDGNVCGKAASVTGCREAGLPVGLRPHA